MAEQRSDRLRLSLLRLEHRLLSEDSVPSKKKRRSNLSHANTTAKSPFAELVNTADAVGIIPTSSPEALGRPPSIHVEKHGICTRSKGNDGGADGADNSAVYSMHNPSQSNNIVEARSQSKHENGKSFKEYENDVYLVKEPCLIDDVSGPRPQSIHVKEHESYKCFKDSENGKSVKDDDDDNDAYFMKEPCQSNHVKEHESYSHLQVGGIYPMHDPCPSNNLVSRKELSEAVPGINVKEQKIYRCSVDDAVCSRSNSVLCTPEPEPRSQHIPAKDHEKNTCFKNDDVYSIPDPSQSNNIHCIKRCGEVNEAANAQDVVMVRSQTVSESIDVKEQKCDTCIKDDLMASMDMSFQSNNALCIKNCGEVKLDVGHCAKINLRDYGISCKDQVPANIVQEGFTLPSHNVQDANSIGVINVPDRPHSIDPIVLSEDEEQIYDAIFSNDSGEDSCSQLVFPGQWDPWDIGRNTIESESNLSLEFLPTPSINVCSDMLNKMNEEHLGNDSISDLAESPVDSSADLHHLCELLGLNINALFYNDESRLHDIVKHDDSGSLVYSNVDRLSENDFSEYGPCLDSWIQRLLKEEMDPFCCALLLIAKSSLHRSTDLPMSGALKIPSMVRECLFDNKCRNPH